MSTSVLNAQIANDYEYGPTRMVQHVTIKLGVVVARFESFRSLSPRNYRAKWHMCLVRISVVFQVDCIE